MKIQSGNPLCYRDGMEMDWTGKQLDSVTTDDYTAEYEYNIDGMRTKKTVDGDVTYYFYDSEGKLIGLQNSLRAYAFYYDSNDSISSMSMNGTYYYFLKNYQGDVVAVTTDKGTIKVRYTYDSWGNTTSVTDANGNDVSSGVTAQEVPFRYRGYVYDYETGLYYLQSRYYDPETGRFISADAYCDTESGSPLSTNMYSYCENDPVNNTDEQGYWDVSIHKKMCRSAGFSDTVVEWVQYADTKFSSDKDYSAPFHSRDNGTKIAKYIYNKAIKIKKEKKKVKFYYSDDKSKKNKKACLYKEYLGFKNKKTKDTSTTTEKAELLISMLNALGNYKKQADALVGLALHVLQDHFAHMVDVAIINKKSKKTIFEGTATEYNQSEGKTSEFEDNTKVLPWRYNRSIDITNELYKYYKKSKKINKIYKKYAYKNGVKVKVKRSIPNKSNLLVESYKYKIVIE